ncbi:MAG: hypothetical protein ACREOG_21825 [Gemmatimonadaceae bacterium]
MTAAEIAPVVEMPEQAPTPTPYQPAWSEREAWETMLEPTPPIAELSAMEQVRPRAEQVPLVEERDPTPVFMEAQLPEAEIDAAVTAEVPAYVDHESPTYSTEELRAYATARDTSDELERPLFVAPASDPPTDSLIDEVDAAFITSGLPSGGAAVASEAALSTAAMLDTIARRLRAGEIQLPASSAASTASEEAALATVLAALLANR